MSKNKAQAQAQEQDKQVDVKLEQTMQANYGMSAEEFFALSPKEQWSLASTDKVASEATARVASLMASTTHEVGKDEMVFVGDKELTVQALKQTVVTAQTLIAYSKVSNMALSCEMGKLTKAGVERDGFKSVTSFIKQAFGAQQDVNTLGRYYRVGRIFGDPATHTWKRPIPADVSITNLGVCLSLIDTSDIDKWSDTECMSAFNSFMDKYVYTDKIALRSSLQTIRKDVKAILNPDTADIPATAQEVQEGEQEQAQDVEITPEVEAQQAQDSAREAVDILYTYFAGRDDVIALIAQIADLI